VALLVVATTAQAQTSTQRAVSAIDRLAGTDAVLRAGKLGLAHAGYLGILKEYPTWWIPTVKAGVSARGLGNPVDTVRGYLERAATLSPSGGYVALALLALAVESGARDAAAARSGDAATDGTADRAGLIRAAALSRDGRADAAVAEYRRVLDRTPGCLAARWGLARALHAAGRAGEAATLLRDSAPASLFPPRWRAEAERPPSAASGGAR
jgi:hypothetical protein